MDGSAFGRDLQRAMIGGAAIIAVGAIVIWELAKFVIHHLSVHWK